MNIEINKIKGIIFDYGGTLDSGGKHWSEVLWDSYIEAGVRVDKADFREAYVYTERELARERHILPAHDFHDMLLIKVQIELEYLVREGHFSPDDVESKTREIADLSYEAARQSIEKARPVLEELSQKYELVMVSNFYGNIETVLQDFGIKDYFKAIIESAVLGIRKPDSRIFEHGVKALGLQPEETLVIGDSLKKDILPAESIGCQVLWLKGEAWSEEENEAFHPNIIRELGETLGILKGDKYVQA